MTSKYQVKLLGKPQECLGWSLTYDNPDGILMICQHTLAKKKLENSKMKECNPRQTPYNNDEAVLPPHLGDNPTPQHQEKARELVSDLRYLAGSTRPDIGYITGKIGATLTNPTYRHWEELKTELRYLKNTTHLGISCRGPTDTTCSETTTLFHSFQLCV